MVLLSRPNYLYGFIWVFPKIGVPQNGWFIRETQTPICLHWCWMHFCTKIQYHTRNTPRIPPPLCEVPLNAPSLSFETAYVKEKMWPFSWVAPRCLAGSRWKIVGSGFGRKKVVGKVVYKVARPYKRYKWSYNPCKWPKINGELWL